MSNFSFAKHLTSNKTLPNPYCLGVYSGPTNSTVAPNPAVPVIQYLLGTFSLLGFFTNALLVLIFVKFKSLRKGVGRVIMQLILTQAVFCGVVTPINMYLIHKATLRHAFSLNCKVCLYQATLHNSLYNLATWTDGVLGLNRFIAVCFPTKFHLLDRKPARYLMFILCWIFALITCVPPWFDAVIICRMNTLGLCVYLAAGQTGSLLLRFNTYCPLFLTSMGTVAVIGKAAWRVSAGYTIEPSSNRYGHRVQPLSNHHGSFASNPVQVASATSVGGGNRVTLLAERRKEISRMLTVGFIVNLICISPLVIGGFFNQVFTAYPEISLIYRFLAVFQYTIVPIIFFGLNADYRAKFKRLCAG